MQSMALSSRMNMNRPIPVARLVADISDKAQVNTHQYGGRPFGVGLLVAGVDVRDREWTVCPSCYVGDGAAPVRVLAVRAAQRLPRHGHWRA